MYTHINIYTNQFTYTYACNIHHTLHITCRTLHCAACRCTHYLYHIYVYIYTYVSLLLLSSLLVFMIIISITYIYIYVYVYVNAVHYRLRRGLALPVLHLLLQGIHLREQLGLPIHVYIYIYIYMCVYTYT